MRFKAFGRVFEIRAALQMGDAREKAWIDWLDGGRYLDPLTAIRVSAVFRCVDLVSKTIAALPLNLLEHTATGAERARGHPGYELCYALPNHATTAYEFWQMFVANLLLTHGAYAKVMRDRRGRLVALWNIPTANCSGVRVNRVNGETYIDVQTEDGFERLREGQFLYVSGFRLSSLSDPENPLSIAADALGLTRHLTQFAEATFKQGVNPGGFLEVPGGLSQEAYARLKADFNEQYSGVMGTGRFIPLEEGAKANLVTRDLEKTQALESRKFAVTEICRFFGVPAHLCMDMEHSTYSNIEQQSREYVRDCVRPLCTRIEQALFRDLLTPPEREKLFYKFNLNGLLEGDTATRTAYYNMMRQNGVMNADEIRALEDMNDQPDGQGKIYMVNGNMIAESNVPMNLPRGAQKAGGTGGAGGANDQKPMAG